MTGYSQVKSLASHAVGYNMIYVFGNGMHVDLIDCTVGIIGRLQTLKVKSLRQLQKTSNDSVL
jgi:hypothetical protein